MNGKTFISAGLLLLIPLLSQAQPLETRGVIQPWQQATLSAEIAAKVERIPFRGGESFHKGDLLLGFECEIFEAQVEKVTAEVKAAKAKLENDKRLDQMRSIGKLEVVLSEVSLEQSEAELKMADFNRKRCVIRAPWDGRVVERLVNEQESVELNQQLLSIVSSEKLEVELVTPGDWLQWLKPQAPFTIRIDETGQLIDGKVLVLGSVVDSTSQTVTVRGEIENYSQLLPGMSGTVIFNRVDETEY